MKKVVMDYEYQIFSRKNNEEIFRGSGSYSYITFDKFVGGPYQLKKIILEIEKSFPEHFSKITITNIEVMDIGWFEISLICLWVLTFFYIAYHMLKPIVFS